MTNQNSSHVDDIVDVPLGKSYRLAGHGPVIILSTTDGTIPNAASVQWLMPADYDPPLFLAVIEAGQLSPEHEVYLLRAVFAQAQRDAVSERWQYNIKDWPTLHHIGNRIFGVCRTPMA